MSYGWQTRLEILRRDTERHLLEPLQTHGWEAKIAREVESGEYLVVEAERGGHRHVVGILYTSSTANTVYKKLDAEVEHVFINGRVGAGDLKAHAYGITTPVTSSEDFYDVLVQWNSESADGKFSPAAPTGEVEAVPENHRLLLSETPIEAIWLRLRQLESRTLARKLLDDRSRREGHALDEEVLDAKAAGLSHAVRNATDYFRVGTERSVNQRVLNLYYGSLAFAFAEMLSAPDGPATLEEIEETTKQGHGLYTVDGLLHDLPHLVVGVLRQGFFARWMQSLGHSVEEVPMKKPRRHEDLDAISESMWVTVEALFSRIPEVGDLFIEIFDAAPGSMEPNYDTGANKGFSLHGSRKRPRRSYVQLADRSRRITKEMITKLPGPIEEISEVRSEAPGRHFRVAIEHPDHEYWHGALPLHHSPFASSSLIFPIFGTVGEFRAICVVLLYALSIVVRYRPSMWRRVEEGDLDHMRVLVDAFLAVVERMLPEEFLARITGTIIMAKQPGGFF